MEIMMYLESQELLGGVLMEAAETVNAEDDRE